MKNVTDTMTIQLFTLFRAYASVKDQMFYSFVDSFDRANKRAMEQVLQDRR